MAEVIVTRTDRVKLNETLDRMLKTSAALKVTIKDSSTGKWGMSRLWRSWMASTAQWMAKQGSRMPVAAEINGKPTMNFFHPNAIITEWRPFDGNDAHEAFTRKWLGTNNNGERLSWKRDEGVNVADKGQRYEAMVQHQVYMLEKGIQFMDPRDSEFRQLCQHYGLN